MERKKYPSKKNNEIIISENNSDEDLTINSSQNEESVGLIFDSSFSLPGINREDLIKQFPAVFEKKNFENKLKFNRPSHKAKEKFIEAFGDLRSEGETDSELFQRLRETYQSQDIAIKCGLHKSEISRLARNYNVKEIKNSKRRLGN